MYSQGFNHRVHILLEGGADRSVVNERGEFALHRAATNPDAHVVSLCTWMAQLVFHSGIVCLNLHYTTSKYVHYCLCCFWCFLATFSCRYYMYMYSVLGNVCDLNLEHVHWLAFLLQAYIVACHQRIVHLGFISLLWSADRLHAPRQPWQVCSQHAHGGGVDTTDVRCESWCHWHSSASGGQHSWCEYQTGVCLCCQGKLITMVCVCCACKVNLIPK